MGQFSWITQDTNKSISNLEGYTFKVVMRDNKGNRWVEKDYEGYGVFGGKDYYELVAEMNGFPSDRDTGIDLSFNPEKFKRAVLDIDRIIYPSLTEGGEYYDGEKPEDCPDQGWTGPEKECDCYCSCC
jgi:hypothetical protein